MTTHEKLKQQLEAAGWNTDQQRPSRGLNDCDWYTWATRETRKTATNCACNGKPPSLIIEPCSFELNGRQLSSVTFRLCGELPNGKWVDFKVYIVDMDECMQEIEPSKAILLASWEAACAASPIN